MLFRLASQVVLMVKNPPAEKNNARDTRDTRDMGFIPGLGRYSGVGNGYLLLYSWLENSIYRELGGLQSMRLQRIGHD